METVTVERIRTAISSYLNVEPSKIQSEVSYIVDLGADSLDLVGLIANLEKELQIDIPEEDYELLTTFGETLSYLEAKLGPVQ
jgi:acyl carrier protein